jgi:hypothetical protein
MLGYKRYKSKMRLGNKINNRRPIGNKSNSNSHYDSLPEEHKLHALLSDEAYSTNRTSNVKGYNYDESLSNERTAVYHNPELNRNIIAHRGTTLNMKDLKSDVNITLGAEQLDKRTKESRNITKKTMEKYNDATTYHTGHSLGANQAKLMSKEFNQKATLFNPGSGFSIGAVKDKLLCNNPIKSLRPAHCDKQKAYHIAGDPLSLLGRLDSGNTRTLLPKRLNTHSLSNFLPT